jgi:hypothetical protein
VSQTIKKGTPFLGRRVVHQGLVGVVGSLEELRGVDYFNVKIEGLDNTFRRWPVNGCELVPSEAVPPGPLPGEDIWRSVDLLRDLVNDIHRRVRSLEERQPPQRTEVARRAVGGSGPWVPPPGYVSGPGPAPAPPSLTQLALDEASEAQKRFVFHAQAAEPPPTSILAASPLAPPEVENLCADAHTREEVLVALVRRAAEEIRDRETDQEEPARRPRGPARGGLVKNVYRLNYGINKVTLSLREPLTTAVVRVWRDGMHQDHLQVLVDGREAGGASGHLDMLEAWFSGWLYGHAAGRDGTRT